MVKRLAIAILLLPSLLLNGCGDEVKVVAPKIGEAVADARFVGLDGGDTSLAEHSGKVVMVHFWATWCAPCRKEMPSLERLAQKLDSSRFALIGVSVDQDINLVKEFKLKYGIKFANHIDLDMDVAQGQFGASAFPESFLIGRDGKLVRHMIGEHDWDTPAMMQLFNDAYSGVETRSGAYW
ncbi:MAG: TlpA family protein disulfide reductase [Chromatiales bacterium]|nr:TlpA family protein disulfide reductase [Chromatiales bacterium]